MSKVRIETGGHVVEIEDDKLGVRALAGLAFRTWSLTLPKQTMQVGFGSQLVERAADQPVAGSQWNGQVEPATG